VALWLQHSLQQRQELRLKLSPQILMSLQYLQMPIQDLEQRLTQEVAENPFLEIAETPPEEPAPEERLEEQPAADAEEAEARSHLDQMESEIAEYMNRSSEAPRRAFSADYGDAKMEALSNAPAHGETLQEHLQAQLGLLEIDDSIRKALQVLLENLDPQGYLPYNLVDLAPATGFALETMEEALRLLQSLDPPGVGARNLRECLLLQLDPQAPRHALARTIVAEHLETLSKNQLPRIARATGASLEEINDAVDVISRLNPRPASAYGREETHYVTPDVLVEEVDGRFEVRLEHDTLPPLVVSPLYRNLLRQGRDNLAVAQMLRRKFENAKWVVASIEQRRMTLYNVARAIVDAQENFMRRGVEALKPLRMQDVAEKLGVHVSTVGRAISQKYLQTPRGIFSLKFFFTGGTTDDDGRRRSWRSVKDRIANLVESEDKRNPLSDEEIVDKLRAEGLDVARRTIAKYRILMKIPSSRKRKQY